MSMSKKHFIALADAIREHNLHSDQQFNSWHLDALAAFCLRQNPNFNMNRWIGYVKGQCGKNGGTIK